MAAFVVLAMAFALSLTASASPATAASPAADNSKIVDLNLPKPLGSFDKLSTNDTRVPNTFRTQADRSGLTAKQSTMIQAAIDYYVATTGGKQVSYNTVEVKGIQLAFPTPKADSKALSPAAVRGCDDGWFCMWHAPGWGGGWPDGPDPDLKFYYCTKTAISGWVGYGSYINNQTPGTIATFYGRNGTTVVGWSAAAYASDSSYDWTPVWYVKPC